MRGISSPVLILLVCAVACAPGAKLPVSAGTGPTPTIPGPHEALIPTVKVATAKGWPADATPNAVAGTRIAAFARDLDHPRWLYVLPKGDVLVAETNAPADRPDDGKGIKGWFLKRYMKKAGAAVPSANRITLLRDTNGDGVADVRTTFLDSLQLVADDVGNVIWRVTGEPSP